jgi:hypothetical protein
VNIKLGSHLLKSWALQQSQGGFIRAEKAISVGVIATDLATNALKYAYPNANPGRYGCASLGTLKTRCLLRSRITVSAGTRLVQYEAPAAPAAFFTALACNLGTSVEYLDGPECRASPRFKIRSAKRGYFTHHVIRADLPSVLISVFRMVRDHD